MGARKHILILHTGGTLAMETKRGRGPLRPGDFERTLRARVPEIWQLANIRFQVFSNIDSSDMRPELWSSLAERVFESLGGNGSSAKYDGVVLTHGTDTMSWTASALSFMLRGLRKPVVITGSQRPLGELRTDARVNLIDAVTAAVEGPGEVTVCFDSKLYRGNRTRKTKTNDFDAFESPNYPVLGTLGVEVVFSEGRAAEGRFRVMPDLEPRVFLLKIFPGMPPTIARAILPGLAGLVVEGFGAGNFPVAGDSSLLPLFDEAHDRGIPVVMVTQARCNSVDLTLYEAGAQAAKRGVIGGGDMTPEAAVTKLMHVLAYERDPERVRRQLERNLVGERTEAPRASRAGAA